MSDSITPIFHPMDQFVVVPLVEIQPWWFAPTTYLAALLVVVLPLFVASTVARKRPLWLAMLAGVVTYMILGTLLDLISQLEPLWTMYVLELLFPIE